MKRILCLALCAVVFACVAPASHASVIQYAALLNGPSEQPANLSPGTGVATVDYDDMLHTLILHVDFVGLLGNTTASHIHSATAVAGIGTAGVATTTPTLAGFPSGVTAGSYDNVLDLTLASSWNPAYIAAHGGTTAGAETDLALGLADGKAYWNIHTSQFSGGEIRGFLAPVPEPASLALLGFGALLWRRRR